MDQSWISIISFSDYNEAIIVHSMLESEGINAVMQDKASIQNYSEAFMHGSIRIHVPQDQVEKSNEILNAKGYEVGNSETEFEKRLARFLIRLKAKCYRK